MIKRDKIGLFDSGIGGFGVAKEINKLLPNEDILYYADNENMPFGNKNVKRVLDITADGVDYLWQNGAKIIVLACNTATGIGVRSLRKHLKIDIIGTEPAIKSACQTETQNKIISLTTLATACSEGYFDLIHKLDNKNRIFTMPLITLATDVENNFFNREFLKNKVGDVLSSISVKSYESIVLGCTHYAVISNIFREVLNTTAFGKNISLYDGNVGVAKRVQAVLSERSLLRENSERIGQIDVVSTIPHKQKYYEEVIKYILSEN